MKRACCLLLLVVSWVPAYSGLTNNNNECDSPGEAPDVIVGDLPSVQRWGSLGGITAYSVATTSCNVGSCQLNWFSGNTQHPVIGTSMYRLKDGRFEQIGQSWLKHGFFALSNNLCSNNCLSTNGQHLGVNCSDPYSAGLNGSQSGLGPKFEVNASTGEFAYPFTNMGQTGNSIYKRLQVHNSDLDPALNTGARYFVDGHYVTNDDALAGNHFNNVSYREIVVNETGPDVYNIQLIGSTQRENSAIRAWRQEDGTMLRSFDIPGDGRITVGSKASDLGTGWWHYEFAVENMNSDRSVRTFSVPLPYGVNLANIGFHDVDYHSGEPYDGTDWSVTVADHKITWSTGEFEQNPGANAIRWGTIYNFRFEADSAPVTSDVAMDLFRPGIPESIQIEAHVPTICDNDGICDFAENCVACPGDCDDQAGGGGCCGDDVCNTGENSCSCTVDCGPPPIDEFLCDDGFDEDCDGNTDCADPDCCSDAACAGPDNDSDLFGSCDCDDTDGSIWTAPGEVDNLWMAHDPPAGVTTLNWSPPIQPGADSLTYETLRSINPINFVTSTICVTAGDPSGTSVSDSVTPLPGQPFYYLVRARNACPTGGQGALGRTTQSLTRVGVGCP